MPRQYLIPLSPGAIEWLVEMSKHFNVVIFTTRGKTDAGRQAVLVWLLKHGLHKAMTGGVTFPVTAEKPPALIYLDDRGWRFEDHFPDREEILAAKPWKVGGETR